MRFATYDPLFKRLVRALAVGLGRLDKEQGRISRGNARHEVRLQAKRIIAMMDAEYPVIPKPKLNIGSDERQGRARSSPEQRAARWRLKMKRRGWAPVGDTWKLARLAEAKASIRRAPIGCNEIGPWTQLWALLAIESALLKSALLSGNRNDDRTVVASIRTVSKSRTKQRALLAAARLSGSPLLNQRGPGTP